MPLSLPEHQCIRNRPLVLLAGWLQCKHQHLKRYETWYKSLGYNVLIRIPSPTMILLAAIATASTSTYPTQNGLMSFTLGKKVETMEFMAFETIQRISDMDCCSVVVHVFSNGGAFLWEAMRQILFHPPSISKPIIPSQSNSGPIEKVKKQIIGIVFDSSPAEYFLRPDLISNAFTYCPVTVRLRVKLYLILRAAQTGWKVESSKRSQRAFEYWDGMRNCNVPLPQLYIYSINDTLTPFDPLRELIDYRRRVFGNDRILSLELDSAHCKHGVTYPKEYYSAVETFLDLCCGNKHTINGTPSRNLLKNANIDGKNFQLSRL